MLLRLKAHTLLGWAVYIRPFLFVISDKPHTRAWDSGMLLLRYKLKRKNEM
jgi:hypothetical protein